MTVEIEKLKALALAATPGPWQWWTSNSTLRLTGADGRDGGVLYGYVHSGDGDVMCGDENRAFIEASNPAAVLELIADNERLRADAERYRWLCANNFDRNNELQVHTWAHNWEPHTVSGEPVEWKQRVRGGALDSVIDEAMKKGAQS